MNRISPLYILYFLLLITLFSFIFIFLKEKELKEETINLRVFYQKVTNFTGLREEYSNKNNIRKKIQSIINAAKKEDVSINANFKSKMVILEINSSNTSLINKFINKILNEKLKIKKLNISRSSIFVEIELV